MADAGTEPKGTFATGLITGREISIPYKGGKRARERRLSRLPNSQHSRHRGGNCSERQKGLCVERSRGNCLRGLARGGGPAGFAGGKSHSQKEVGEKGVEPEPESPGPGYQSSETRLSLKGEWDTQGGL